MSWGCGRCCNRLEKWAILGTDRRSNGVGGNHFNQTNSDSFKCRCSDRNLDFVWTVPTMIYYSLLILDPSIFYAAACVICGLIALSIGSSWTVAGTVGIALIGAAIGMNLSVEITAGAIISGAYFGDKMSPLSETTNLAPAVAGTDLFSHMVHMVWTAVPSFVLALLAYLFIGLNIENTDNSDNLIQTMDAIKGTFVINPILLLPVLILLVMANKRFPPIPNDIRRCCLSDYARISFSNRDCFRVISQY